MTVIRNCGTFLNLVEGRVLFYFSQVICYVFGFSGWGFLLGFFYGGGGHGGSWFYVGVGVGVGGLVWTGFEEGF